MELTSNQNTPLCGIRILDLTNEKASYCSKILADLGAHVTKLEKPGGDPSRRVGPFWKNSAHCEESLSFWYNNTNKLGITLNLEQSDGRKIFVKLIEKTDVVVESFPSGHLDKLGLSFEFLSGVNPRLIMTSVTAFGQNGPRKGFKSCDFVASALGGQMYVCGSPSLPPLKAYGQQSYLMASLYAAVGILLALRRRSKTGTGDHIDISLQEAVASNLEHVMVRYFHERVVPERLGNRNWNDFFCVMPCKDGFIHITPFFEWETLVDLLDSEGKAEDLTDEKWKNEAYRSENLDHVLDVLEQWTKAYKVDELFQLGQLMRFPWAPIRSSNEILLCPQLQSREFFIEIDHPELGTVLSYPGSPYRFSSGYSMPRKKAPLAGENNVRVYQGELGLSNSELESLSRRGII